MGGINMVALVLNGLKPESYVLINSFSLFLDLKWTRNQKYSESIKTWQEQVQHCFWMHRHTYFHSKYYQGQNEYLWTGCSSSVICYVGLVANMGQYIYSGHRYLFFFK